MVKKETVIATIKKVLFDYTESNPESLLDVASMNKLLCKAINELPDDDGWIPVEERLPEIGEGYASPKVRVTVQGRKGELEVMVSRRLKGCDEEHWMIESGAVWKVLAWQPLTTAYSPPKQYSKLPKTWIDRTMSEFERVE